MALVLILISEYCELVARAANVLQSSSAVPFFGTQNYQNMLSLLEEEFQGVEIDVWQSYQYRDYLTALSKKDLDGFSHKMALFGGIIVLSIPLHLFTKKLEAKILLGWRIWMTEHFLKMYLSDKNYYKMANGATGSGSKGVDNPDQRIAADIETFTRLTFNYSIDVVETLLRFFSFSTVLWDISPLLFIFLCVYSFLGTWLTTFFFGNRLSALNFKSRQLEADFRYSIVRIRDNAESIALYGGENSELEHALGNLRQISNHASTQQYWNQWLYLLRKILNYATLLMPTLIIVPEYFAGSVDYGAISQANIVFSEVKSSLFNIIDNFTTITSLQATMDRLEVFIDQNTKPATVEKQFIHTKVSNEVYFDTVTLYTPNYEQLLWRDISFVLPEHQSLLVVGPSGCGKSSLFRAIARLWESGSGTIAAPATKDTFILPQHPYAPLGTLKHLLMYPYFKQVAQEPTETELQFVLEKVNLGKLPTIVGGFSVTASWSSMLSLGEMQRVGFARLLLAQRKFALLDEATSALDINNEATLYRNLTETCSSFVSISHRPSLLKYHQFVLEIVGPDVYHFIPADQYKFPVQY